jgi:hypothetical protein
MDFFYCKMLITEWFNVIKQVLSILQSEFRNILYSQWFSNICPNIQICLEVKKNI